MLQEIFEPLEEIVSLLRSYGMVVSERVLGQLEELPERWANTKRLSVTARQEVTLAVLLTLQSYSVLY